LPDEAIDITTPLEFASLARLLRLFAHHDLETCCGRRSRAECRGFFSILAPCSDLILEAATRHALAPELVERRARYTPTKRRTLGSKRRLRLGGFRPDDRHQPPVRPALRAVRAMLEESRRPALLVAIRAYEKACAVGPRSCRVLVTGVTAIAEASSISG